MGAAGYLWGLRDQVFAYKIDLICMYNWTKRGRRISALEGVTPKSSTLYEEDLS